MGIDDDEKEDDEDDIGEFAGFLPDLVDGGVAVGGDGRNDEKVVDEVVDFVGETTGGVEEGAESPRDRASFALADVGVFFVSCVGG